MDAGRIEQSGLTQTLGIELREATQSRVVATMPVTPRVHQPFGYLHGGASLVLAETVASVGAALHCPPGKIALGQEINANHLRPVREGMLTAIGIPLHAGRSSHVWEIKIYDEAERLICVSRCTVAIVAAERKPEH
jgi:uncharacterized protein (TIGR00369 family)